MEDQPQLETLNKFIKQVSILRIFEENEELSMLPEDELLELAQPNSVLWELRVSLWKCIQERENHLANFGNAQELKCEEIIRGICSQKKFWAITQSKFKCEFLSRPIRDFENSSEDLAKAAQARLWEILSMPIKDKLGMPDPKMTKIVFDCAKMVLDRKYGQATQKTELYAKVQSNHSISSQPPMQVATLDVDAQIAQIEEQLHGRPPPKDTEVKEITTGSSGETEISVASK